MRVSEESLYEGLKMARAGNHLTDISHAIGEYVFTHGYSIPRDYAGHGIGTSVHEDPTVPNLARQPRHPPAGGYDAGSGTDGSRGQTTDKNVEGWLGCRH